MPARLTLTLQLQLLHFNIEIVSGLLSLSLSNSPRQGLPGAPSLCPFSVISGISASRMVSAGPQFSVFQGAPPFPHAGSGPWLLPQTPAAPWKCVPMCKTLQCSA